MSSQWGGDRERSGIQAVVPDPDTQCHPVSLCLIVIMCQLTDTSLTQNMEDLNLFKEKPNKYSHVQLEDSPILFKNVQVFTLEEIYIL